MTNWDQPVGRYFTLREVKCHHCNNLPPHMDRGSFERFVAHLDYLRRKLGKPLLVNSWYRCPDHPIEKAKPEPGIHSFGLAVDLRLDGQESLLALRVLSSMDRSEYMGFGISQRKDCPRYLHFDHAGHFHRWVDIRPNVWSY